MTGRPIPHAELIELGTATVSEASGEQIVLPPRMRPVWPGATVAGTAFPVRAVAGDNLPLHLAVELAGEGDVLVVDAAGAPHGYWGEVLAVAAACRGIRGLVIDGGVRDTARLEQLGFPVWSSTVALAGTVKRDSGGVGDPISLGGVRVARGDLVLADGDGVVVLPADRLPAVLDAARERVRTEAGYLERLRAGELTVDLLDLPRPTRKA
ncbi:MULTISPECIES: 4-carboxy-4-hydroxy-2-oxoadipate aldolase/oxaloacetate decarboxylase [Pseudonocardia]|uniref:Putative 4-hydroxy-4-methyl-2-oxoglutarate aldolase n=2 Tax=Pseudonocardia TaxID=1847 RepID=A0A1Y2MYT4_PSEAH|nr:MULTISPECIES: 4-carboxy-4-hydroxy-2-oxoadipate aldolase/oxaloacetate decarboxylase [Pseudonocardia]OSY40376.1 4-hydroxy-4-methyl-2-oxoglutarate aldolase [Pseudonocardia autotrophica]TDN72293.1 4-hydroxy-4-methyl-2-oxoglutarate aldolase [Pseudonocardia autotrophica]BBG03005.1 4-carboxy-4-hydroxy-2-oxoadipate aldolase [Pseudonocardia autotrophica]GEC25093.1 4-carboxy-4-hydroxy-2-oxoadipate aldolase [Pseudonocardia saturnea]